MNRIAIFYPLALFCISSAFAQANRDIFSRIKGAILINNSDKKDTYTFDKEEVNLYKTVDEHGTILHYDIKDGSGISSPDFAIPEWRTVVTDKALSIRDAAQTVTLTPNEDTFEFYLKLFDLENFGIKTRMGRQGAVTGTYDEMNKFDSVTVDVLENNFGGEWLFVALEGDTPRLIFPSQRVTMDPKQGANKKITCKLQAEREIPITMEFDDSIFYDKIRQILSS